MQGLQSKKTHTSWFACVILAKEMLKFNDNQRSLFKSCQLGEVDILGSFPITMPQKKFIVVDVDYFTK
ncbi:hypothetical protein EPI10_000664 [Gossypium australe]|uniref:Uncharacterized protein n=1 Tax=Gossypium australe TaxID=47621 RepID=A0A5B6V8P1_9ROSI|nr:hypothetical protein EPI10_000664 [Gossypium australe]